MDLFDLLVRLETELWNDVERDLRRSEQVGLGTLMALRVLHSHGTNGRVHDISTDLAISIGASSKLVDRLENGGLAVRRPHPQDRRSSLIALTAEGDLARISGEKIARQKLTEVIGHGGDTAALYDLLTRLGQRMAAAREQVSA